MPNLLLSFESPENCNLVASVLTAAQATGQQISGVRAANLLQRLTGGCVVYGPLPDGRWLPDAGVQSPGSPAPSATHTPNTPKEITLRFHDEGAYEHFLQTASIFRELLAVVRLQNGNLHQDTNQLQERASKALSCMEHIA